MIGLLAARLALGADAPAPSDAPNYTAASVVNAADNSGLLAPNAIATIYGLNLAFSSLGTSVLVEGVQATLFYVSPSKSISWFLRISRRFRFPCTSWSRR